MEPQTTDNQALEERLRLVRERTDALHSRLDATESQIIDLTKEIAGTEKKMDTATITLTDFFDKLVAKLKAVIQKITPS